MSKWLSVCIFLLLAIACTVDVEPMEIGSPAGPEAPAGRGEMAIPVTSATPAEIVTPEALAWQERTHASASLGAKGNDPRVFDTREWSRVSTR